MKKLIILTLISFNLWGITNTQAQIKKAAVISIFGNKNLSDNPMDTKLYQLLLQDSSFDISGTVTDFEKIITEKMVPRFSFPFKDKQEVVSNEEYQKISSTVIHTDEEGKDIANYLNPYVPAEGYKNLAAFGIVNDKKAISRCFEIFPDVDAVMIAYIDYNLYDAVGAMGISSKKVYANCNIKMFNKEGDRIFKLKERSSSNKGVVAAGGIVVDPDKLKPMIYEASEKLLQEMQTKFVKSIEKMAKKLKK